MQPKPPIWRLIVALAACALATWVFAAGASAQPQPGDVLVIDPDVPPVNTAVLFQVDPQTGERTVLHSFGASSPSAVAVEVDGGILVTDTAAGTDPSGGTSEWGVLYRLSPDPVTGELVRTMLTDFGVGPNTGRNPRAVTVEADGQILVTTGIPGTLNNRALLVRVDPVTGARAIVSDFGDSSQGGLGIEPRGVAVEAGGAILVIDAQGGTSALGELFRVDPQTGARTSVSNFGAGPLNGINPTSVAVEANGQILVTDEGHGSLFPLGLLLRIDPQTGVRSILSNLNTAPNTGREPEGVAIEANGQILVIDKHAGPLTRGMLFRVDPQTGARQIVSDFGAGANQGGEPLALAIVPGVVVPPSQATLVVVNEVVNDNGGTAVASDWATTVTGGNPAPASFQGASAPGTTVMLDTGAYSVSATGPAGYTQTLSSDCTGTVVATEPKICTITNDDQAATLNVIVEVVNDNGGTATASDWTIDVIGGTTTPGSFPGAAAPGTSVTLDAGFYEVRSFPAAGYRQNFSDDCVVTLAAGETKTCTISGDDVPSALAVVNEVVNDNGGTATASDWTISVAAPNGFDTFPGQGPPGTVLFMDAGSYSVSTSALAGYTTALSAECAGTIAIGEHKTCTITHDDQAATLIVIVEVVNDNGGTATASDWTIDVIGTPAPGSFPGAAAPGTSVTLDAGLYEVRSFPAAGYRQNFSDDCIGILTPGGTNTCTITSDDVPPAVSTCDGKVATIVGTPGPTQIRGTSGNDVIVDLDGNNTIRGRGGNDTVCTGPGNDQIYLAAGSDTVIDTSGQNTIHTGASPDSIRTGPGNDTINAGAGADTITDTGGDNTIDASAGNDTLTTGPGNDTINAGAGNDTIDAGEGNNQLNGQGGHDTLTAGAGNDTIDGGLGFDTCTPGPGNNNVSRCEATT